MNNPFNQLTDAEAERLAILMEECSEVIKSCGKILRHGYESTDPTGAVPGTNREQLQEEIGQVMATHWDMAEKGDLSRDAIVDSKFARSQKLRDGLAYLHHQ